MEARHIHTARLRLEQLYTNELGSQQLEWFHCVWSSELASQWRYLGPCKTMEESQQWMEGILLRNSTRDKVKIAYAVLYDPAENTESRDDSQVEWKMAGIVTLLSRTSGSGVGEDGQAEQQGALSSPAVDAVVLCLELGYIFHPNVWGRGYATESVRGLLQAAKEEMPGPVDICVEAHRSNAGSVHVIEKLGFRKTGQFEKHGRLPLRSEPSTEVILHFKARLDELGQI